MAKHNWFVIFSLFLLTITSHFSDFNIQQSWCSCYSKVEYNQAH